MVDGPAGQPAFRLLWVLGEHPRFGPDVDMHTTEALLRAFHRRSDVRQDLTTLRRVESDPRRVRVRARRYAPDVHDGLPIRFGQPVARTVSTYDVVFIRVDPPITETFRHALLQLARAEGEALFVNGPAAILALGSKAFNLRFSRWMPRSRIVGTMEQALAFVASRPGGRWVAKPLDRAGGTDVVRFTTAGAEAELRPLLGRYGFVVVQAYVEAVEVDGEVRCLVFDGRLLAAWRKRPRPGEFRANLDQGATLESVDIRLVERRLRPIVEHVRREAPGFLFYSVDLIGLFVNEINVENVGGLPSADALLGGDHARLLADRILTRLRGRRAPGLAGVGAG